MLLLLLQPAGRPPWCYLPGNVCSPFPHGRNPFTTPGGRQYFLSKHENLIVIGGKFPPRLCLHFSTENLLPSSLANFC
jgi:hypothetical protein